jgi:hypothetical protein
MPSSRGYQVVVWAMPKATGQALSGCWSTISFSVVRKGQTNACKAAGLFPRVVVYLSRYIVLDFRRAVFPLRGKGFSEMEARAKGHQSAGKRSPKRGQKVTEARAKGHEVAPLMGRRCAGVRSPVRGQKVT